METVRVGGHRYSDPDVLSLINATGRLVDPRSAVLTQARRVTAKYRDLGGDFSDPLERVKMIASMLDIKVMPMTVEQRRNESRDAVIINTDSGRQILYNPNRPMQRVAFSISHEISHTFFPNSIKGSRFRNICSQDSREANELERLCDLGAAEILMPIDTFQSVAAGNYGLLEVERLCNFFGSSTEATAYRLATAHSGKAVAGLLRYRLTLPEQRSLNRHANQRLLFDKGKSSTPQEAEPKYRRQSVHLAQQCDEDYIIRWNKSFDRASVVYNVCSGGVFAALEELPNNSGKIGRLEAMLAPYQREDADPTFGDVLFFWEEL